MNEKRAKVLRRAAGYKNSSKTPAKMKFPGVARMVKFPTVSKSEVQRFKRGHPFHPRIVETAITLDVSPRFIRTGKFWNAEVTQMLTTDKDGEIIPAFELVPLSKPAVHDPKLTPRGAYRALKKLDRTVGLEKVAAGVQESESEAHS